MTSTSSNLVSPSFDQAFRDRLAQLLTWRRDVRSFKLDPLPEGMIERLIGLACLAPSVGLSEPWRFVVVEDPLIRANIRRNFEAANAEALANQSTERAAHYARLKLTGLDCAPVHLAIFVDPKTEQGHGLGRLTMPETLSYSVVAAIQVLWLTARAEGIGLGWVSILDPKAATAAMAVPPNWRLVGYFCVGYPETEDDRPALERLAWERRRESGRRIFYR